MSESVTNERVVDALEIKSLSFSYGKHRALDGIDLAVAPGRFVALLGPNGAGKTTLFSLVTGLYAADSGTINVNGRDLRRETLSALGRMGVVFQRTTLDMDLTVTQNLNYAAALHGISRAETGDRVAAAIKRHGLLDMAKRKVSVLSGGQRRRVELARALLHEPALLLLDEPTVGLDLHSRNEFLEHVKGLCDGEGVGVLWATHLMQEVGKNDDVHVMVKGKIVANGELTVLLSQFDAEDTDALFKQLVKQSTS
ncbi:MAG: ATP-binding cassette domain-containing protein [Granulosicoccus sp.]